MKWDARAVIAVLLTLTVCASILVVVVGAAVRGPGTAPPESVAKMYELVTFIVGVISGWLASKGEKHDTGSKEG